MLWRWSASRRIGALISRADRARDRGRWAVAARFYRRSLAAHPANPAIWVQYGHALKESGRPQEAEAAYRTGIAYGPVDADARLQLAHVLKIQGKRDEAEASYLLAAAIDPTTPEPRQELKGLGWSEPELAELRQPGTGSAASRVGQRDAVRSEFERRRDMLFEAAETARGAERAALRMQTRTANLQSELRLALGGRLLRVGHDDTCTEGRH
jgi:tetratricopeptide (TPR) repeat protein